MTYILHYAPDNASMIVRLVMETAGIPYRTALIDRSIRQQDSDAYRALNPTGLIPTLETPEGPLTETGAILLWLAQTHSLPMPGPRGDWLKWLFFISNTAHADIRQLFYPEYYVPPHATADHHTLLSARMIRHFALLDTAAAQHPALFSPTSILAPYVCALMRWSVLYPVKQTPWFDIGRFPHLHQMAIATESTPAAARVAQAEGLGPTPFSAPHLPRPPEGSAL